MWERAFKRETVFLGIGGLAVYFHINFRRGRLLREHLNKGAHTPKLIKTKKKQKKAKMLTEEFRERGICLIDWNFPGKIIRNLNYSIYQTI